MSRIGNSIETESILVVACGRVGFGRGNRGMIAKRNGVSFRGDGNVLKLTVGASLVAQWLRIRLPMQGTRARALVREEPTCRGATKPVRHNY